MTPLPVQSDADKIIEDILNDPINFSKYCCWNNKPLFLRKQNIEILNHQMKYPLTVDMYPRGGAKSFTNGYHGLIDFYTKPGYKSAFISLSQRQSSKVLEIGSRIINQSPLLKPSRQYFQVDQVQRLVSHINSELVALPYDIDTILGEHPHQIFIDEIHKFLDSKIFWESIDPMLSGISALEFIPEIHLTGVGGVQTGVLYEVLSDAEDLGFHIQKKTWQKCEGYDAKKLNKIKLNYPSIYATQYMCEMIPDSSASIPFATIEKNLTAAVNYNQELGCIAGLDLAKLRDKAALCIGQQNGELINVVELYVDQLDYKFLADKIKGYSDKYKISSILVDVTRDSSFLDFGTKPPYNLPLRPYNFGGSSNKRGTLFDNMKIQLEYSRTPIPNIEAFKGLIDGLKLVDLSKHLPDEVVAFMLMLWNLREGAETLSESHAFVSKRRKPFNLNQSLNY